MRPARRLEPITKWILRIAIGIIVYNFYFNTFLKFEFNNFGYFMALAFVLFAVLLIIGGFVHRSTLTVVSGLFIVILALVMIFVGGFTVDKLLTHFPTIAIALYFFTRGNKT
ncbi:MAG: hypothetical protein MI922_29665 [Bacteroidales bacterium]|nr:hypothetical protein [Bacteroidales bacterium]